MNRIDVQFEHLFEVSDEPNVPIRPASFGGSSWTWAQRLDKAAPISNDSPIPDPVGDFFAKAQRVSAGFPDHAPATSSAARFEKVSAEIRRIFGGHDEECAEAILIAKQALIEARASARAMA